MLRDLWNWRSEFNVSYLEVENGSVSCVPASAMKNFLASVF